MVPDDRTIDPALAWCIPLGLRPGTKSAYWERRDFVRPGLGGVAECAVSGKSGLLDAFEVESGYAVEDSVPGDQLRVERQSR